MPTNPNSIWRANPQYDPEILQAKERFLSKIRTHGSSVLRQVIEESWQRCVGTTSPLMSNGPEPVDEATLLKRQLANPDLFRAGELLMKQKENIFEDSGLIMLLADKDGFILSAHGDPIAFAQAEKIHLLPGSDWSEKQSGTNAIGTALTIQQSLEVYGSEHFCHGMNAWTCTAVPIKDPVTNDLLGVVNISGLRPAYAQQNWALVNTIANRLQGLLKKRILSDHYHLVDHFSKQLWRNQTVVLYDKYQRPITSNHPAYLHHLKTTKDGQQVAEREEVEPIYYEGELIGTIVHFDLSKTTLKAPNNLAAVKSHPVFEQIIGSSPQLLETKRKALMLSKNRAAVLITGETGSGKERFSRAIHQLYCAEMKENSLPFVALNCGAFPSELLAGELFGYIDGAFTGAKKGGQPGKLEAANGGVLFLDEIGEMPLNLQSYLLRVLEEGELYRLGCNTPRKVNFKLISATNRDLLKEVEAGNFRKDLYYRLAVTHLSLPPLRDCKSDILQLLNFYLTEIAKRDNLDPKTLSPEVIELLTQYHWPGNIRELRNTAENILLMSEQTIIGVKDLPSIILESQNQTPSILTQAFNSVIPIKDPQDMEGLCTNLSTQLEQSECRSICLTIVDCKGNLSRAARRLGIAKSTLYNKIERYELNDFVELQRQKAG